MFIKLTYHDENKTPIYVNFNLVENYGPDEHGSYVTTATSTFRVKEKVEEINKVVKVHHHDYDEGWK